MKIAIIAYDLWGFNKIIANRLTEMGCDVFYFDSSKISYTYKNLGEKIGNFFSKTFLGVNRKKKFLDQLIIQKLSLLENQDCILIVNPGHFGDDVVRFLKTKTKKYIAYNYDSIARVPLLKNHQEIFDDIFSFDVEDLKTIPYLKPLTNFNYLEKDIESNPENKAFIILSHSKEREKYISKIADILDQKDIANYEFILSGSTTKNLNKNIQIIHHYHSLEEVYEKMKNSEILVDLVRKNQSGLSFRFFEAMALHKKVITNNPNVANYDFYNPNNILIIDSEKIEITDAFLTQPYTPISEDIYQKYTLSHWIETVFGSGIQKIKN